MYPGLRPEPLYLFFAYVNKKFFQNIEQFLSYIKLLFIMSVNEANTSELEALRQRATELEAKNDKLEAENAELKALIQRATELEAEKAEFEAKKDEFLKSTKKYYTEFERYIVKLKHLSSQNPDNLDESIERDIKAQNVRNKLII